MNILLKYYDIYYTKNINMLQCLFRSQEKRQKMTNASFNIKIPEPERIKLYFLNFREQIKVAKTL